MIHETIDSHLLHATRVSLLDSVSDKAGSLTSKMDDYNKTIMLVKDGSLPIGKLSVIKESISQFDSKFQIIGLKGIDDILDSCDQEYKDRRRFEIMKASEASALLGSRIEDCIRYYEKRCSSRFSELCSIIAGMERKKDYSGISETRRELNATAASWVHSAAELDIEVNADIRSYFHISDCMNQIASELSSLEEQHYASMEDIDTLIRAATELNGRYRDELSTRQENIRKQSQPINRALMFTEISDGIAALSRRVVAERLAFEDGYLEGWKRYMDVLSKKIKYVKGNQPYDISGIHHLLTLKDSAEPLYINDSRLLDALAHEAREKKGILDSLITESCKKCVTESYASVRESCLGLTADSQMPQMIALCTDFLALAKEASQAYCGPEEEYVKQMLIYAKDRQKVLDELEKSKESASQKISMSISSIKEHVEELCENSSQNCKDLSCLKERLYMLEEKVSAPVISYSPNRKEQSSKEASRYDNDKRRVSMMMSSEELICSAKGARAYQGNNDFSMEDMIRRKQDVPKKLEPVRGIYSKHTSHQLDKLRGVKSLLERMNPLSGRREVEYLERLVSWMHNDIKSGDLTPIYSGERREEIDGIMSFMRDYLSSCKLCAQNN